MFILWLQSNVSETSAEAPPQSGCHCRQSSRNFFFFFFSGCQIGQRATFWCCSTVMIADVILLNGVGFPYNHFNVVGHTDAFLNIGVLTGNKPGSLRYNSTQLHSGLWQTTTSRPQTRSATRADVLLIFYNMVSDSPVWMCSYIRRFNIFNPGANKSNAACLTSLCFLQLQISPISCMCFDHIQPVINNASSHAAAQMWAAPLLCIDVGSLDRPPHLGEFWLQLQTPEMFISASDLALSDCSNAVWRWGNSSGQSGAFDHAVFLFAFYIRASNKYVNWDVNLPVSQGSYTFTHHTNQIGLYNSGITCLS